MSGHAFRQSECDGQTGQCAETGQHQKDRLPTCGVDQQTAEHRREDRRQAHHQHQLRKDFCRAHCIAFITDHRPRDHHPCATAQCLDEACADQPFKVRRIGARQRSGGEQANAHEQWQAPPETIRYRPVSQLTNGQAKEIRRQGQLDMLLISAEGKRHGRERGQVEIDRQRTECAQGAKNQNCAEVHQASSEAEFGSPTV
ncbi:hypothetical protein D3C86_1075150 [compost metagenome]